MGTLKRMAASAKVMLYGVLVTALFLAVACGAAEKPAAPAAAPQKDAQAAKATPARAAAAAPVAAPKGAQVSGKVTVMNAVWGNEKFEPRSALGEALGFARIVHAFLITSDETAAFLPGVATKWQLSPDGKTWTITVRKGVKFHNGEDLTVDDVVFTMRDTYGPVSIQEAGSPLVSAVAKDTAKVEALGPDTLQVVHNTPRPDFPFILGEQAQGNYGALIPQKYFEQVGRDGYNKKPVGAGPFKFAKHLISEQMTYERFGDYYNPERSAKFQTLDMRLVPEVSTRVAALRAGEADLIEANLSVVKQVEAGGGRAIFAKESSYIWVYTPGCQKPELPCNKRDVRYALDYAIDKQTIMKELYGAPNGGAAKGFSYVTPSALGYSSALDPLPYDPQKAKELLARAGYPGGKGFRPFTIHTWQAGDVPFMPELAELVANYWRKNLGIEATVRVGDATTVKEIWFRHEIDGDFLVRPNETRWDGSSIGPTLYGDPKGRAYIGGGDTSLTEAVKEALSVLDPAKRHEAVNKMYTKFFDAHYEIGVGFVNLPWGVGPRIATYQPWPLTPYLSAPWTITLK